MRVYGIALLFVLAGSSLQAQSDPLDAVLSRASGDSSRLTLVNATDRTLETMVRFEGKFEETLLDARAAMREGVESALLNPHPEDSGLETQDLGDLTHSALAMGRMNLPGDSREKKTRSKFRASLRANMLSRHKEVSLSSRLRPGTSRTSKGRPAARSATLSSNSEDGDGGDGPDPGRTVSGLAEQIAPFSENRIPRSILCTT